MSDRLDKAAKSIHDTLYEPYNPEQPTLTDKAVKFTSDVLYPELNEAQRAEFINRAKPWAKAGWTVGGILDGHLVLAALPWLFGARRQRKAAAAPVAGADRTKFLLFLAAIMGTLWLIAGLASLIGG